MAEKPTIIDQDPKPIKLSVAMVATESHRDEWQSRLLLVRDREIGKWGPPAGSIEKIEDTHELPHQTLSREWKEETTLPFVFKNGIHFLDAIMSTQVNKTSIGFIYEGELTEETINKLSKPLEITTDEDVDMVRLFTYFEAMDLLKDWGNTIKLPGINAITIMKWCNTIRSIGSGPYPSERYEPFTQNSFNMNFSTLSLDKLAREMKFDSV